MNRKFSPDRWRRLMTYAWLAEKPDLGRVAVVDGRVVGYVGMVYADRQIEGCRHRVVNICAWYLDKAFRGLGLGFELMRSATADPQSTYTNLTSSSRTLKLLDRAGFRVLDGERRLWVAEGPPARLDIERDERQILRKCEAAEAGLLRDHAGLPIYPVLIEEGTESCLAVFSVKQKHDDETYFDLLHLSNPRFFTARAQAVADCLLPRNRRAVLAADARLLMGQSRGGTIRPMRVPRYFKSSRLAPGAIDNMYSELQLLDLKLD
ncbi:MAG TPA: GNAT family N-acetyltransferase [Candidatus Udaeobacter sp.]|nr:GNAT family N-acetyltransferase [Candidatus Udaeobacter sp.]